MGRRVPRSRSMPEKLTTGSRAGLMGVTVAGGGAPPSGVVAGAGVAGGALAFSRNL